MRSGILVPRAGLVFFSVLWLGILIGVSFLATPVKFQAQLLSLPAALDVGQVTFALFSKVEWALAVATAGCLAISRPGKSETLSLAAVLIIIAAQALWLLPVLDMRLEAVIAGTPPPRSSHHMIYIAAEAAKALLLLVLGLAAFRHLARDQDDTVVSASTALGRS